MILINGKSIPELYSDLKKDTEWELGIIYQSSKIYGGGKLHH